MNIAVFASHEGTDLQAIIDACKSGIITARVCVVISNNADSRALERARRENIGAYYVNYKSSDSEKEINEKIVKILERHSADIVFLAGYLKKLGEEVLSKYENRIYNIHPALLPKFGGKGMYGINVHRAVIESKETESGITIHKVNTEYDEGEIVAQTKIAVLNDDTPEQLANRILKKEHLFIVEFLKNLTDK